MTTETIPYVVLLTRLEVVREEIRFLWNTP